MNSNVTGIAQTAIILRSAVVMALHEFRTTPTLIDDCLACLPQDDLTADKYGEKSITICKEWFLNTQVPVKLGLSLSRIQGPMVSIEMSGGSESEVTMSDFNYTVSEEDPHNTGEYRQLGSIHCNENFKLLVMVPGEPENLLFLSSLIRFGLYRHKLDLLDMRGITLLNLQMGMFGALPGVAEVENLFGQYITLSTRVRHVWPIAQGDDRPNTVIADVPVGIRAAISGNQSSEPVTPVSPTVGSWTLDLADWEDRDMLSGRK